MNDINRLNVQSCERSCDDRFRECISTGEHESVCMMKRVPCACRCALED